MEWQEELTYLGIEQLRPHQVYPVRDLLAQNSILCIFPTAAGKSLIYYLATLILKTVAIVIMPLISLYQDYIQKLYKLRLNASKIDDYFDFTVGFIFVTPEMLQLEKGYDFLRRFRHRIGLLVVDECHLITEWGGTFRSSYLRLSKTVSALDVPVCALTGSVISTQAQEIITSLQLKEPKIFLSQFNRKNIFYSTAITSEKFIVLVQLLKKFAQQKPLNDSILVYTMTRAESESLSEKLNNAGFPAASYHAGMELAEREHILSSWSANLTKLVVATTAFALGIDKPSVGLVVNYGMPKSIYQFYYESGRAGRNGEQSFSVVITSQEDIQTARFMVQRYNSEEGALSFYYLLHFIYTGVCRRRIVLEYFRSGLPIEKQAICCDNCTKSNIFAKILPRIECSGIDDYFSDLKKEITKRQTLASLAGIEDLAQSESETKEAELYYEELNEICVLVANRLQLKDTANSYLAVLRKLIKQQARDQRILDRICAKVRFWMSKESVVYTINKLMKLIIQESM